MRRRSSHIDRMRRLRAIWAYLETWPRATIYQIGDDLGVSPVTISDDLRQLVDRGIISTVAGATRQVLRSYHFEKFQ